MRYSKEITNDNSEINIEKYGLFPYSDLTENQRKNYLLNQKELKESREVLSSYPRRIVLELTNDCNLRCKMCGRCYDTFKTSFLDMNIVKWLEPVLEYAEEVTFMGWGEPTLYPHFLELFSLIDEYPIKKYICTNGTRLNNIKNILFDYNVDLCAVSINGITPETNDRIRVGASIENIFNDIKNISDEKKLRNTQWPYLSVVFCLSRSNLDDLHDLAEKAALHGIERIKIVHLTAFGSEMENEVMFNCISNVRELFDELKHQCIQCGIELDLPYLPREDPAGTKKHHDCSFPWRDLFVGSDGWVRPCMSTSDRLFPLNIHQQFFDQWNHESMRDYRKYVNNEDYMHDSCKTCYQSSVCNWNMTHAFIQSNKKFSPDWGV